MGSNKIAAIYTDKFKNQALQMKNCRIFLSFAPWWQKTSNFLQISVTQFGELWFYKCTRSSLVIYMRATKYASRLKCNKMFNTLCHRPGFSYFVFTDFFHKNQPG